MALGAADPRQQYRRHHAGRHRNRHHPHRTDNGHLVHQGDWRENDHDHAASIRQHAEHAGLEQLQHRRPRCGHGRRCAGSELVIEAGHQLHGMRDRSRRNQECNHDDQRVQVVANQAGRSQRPDGTGQPGQQRQQGPTPGARRDKQQRDQAGHRDQEDVQRLRQIVVHPTVQDGLTDHAHHHAVAALRVGDLHHLRENLAVVGRAFIEVHRDQRRLQVFRYVGAIDQRIVQDGFAQRRQAGRRIGHVGPHERPHLDGIGRASDFLELLRRQRNDLELVDTVDLLQRGGDRPDLP